MANNKRREQEGKALTKTQRKLIKKKLIKKEKFKKKMKKDITKKLLKNTFRTK